jgi:hypothetical protein
MNTETFEYFNRMILRVYDKKQNHQNTIRYTM